MTSNATDSSTSAKQPAREPALDRTVAMRLAATEYERFSAELHRLSPKDWTRPTDCPAWDVRAVAGHALGMAEMAASFPESLRQMRKATKRAGVFIDALTALQVEEHADLSPDEVVRRYAKTGPRAARGRRRTPGFVRRRRMPVEQPVGDTVEPWTMGFLLDVVLTRDPWMHRVDIARSAGHDPELTADHDGVLVADVVQEWATRHGQPCTLTLGGPAGGSWSFGSGGPVLDLDAVEFCRLLAGRGQGDGPLRTAVPF